MKLFTFLDFSTGFTRDNYHTGIFPNCNSGMELPLTSPHHVIKTPTLLHDIHKVVNNPTIHIECVIIPVRELKASAASRVKHKNDAGGLWNAHDEASQIQYYEHIMSNYIEHMVKHDIPTLFLDFDRMIVDIEYLYEKLRPWIEQTCTKAAFSVIYEEVSRTSRPSRPSRPKTT